jgi:predicted lipid-binding transport protein (Tim44 family)
MKRATVAMLLVGALFAALEAEARVGGGQTFGGGGGSGRSSGGGGGGDGELVFLVIRLLIYYPQLGVPIAIVAIGWWLYTAQQNQHDAPRVVVEEQYRPAQSRSARRPMKRRRADRGWDALTGRDPGLSRPVLYDFLQLVVRRAWAANTPDQREALRPFVAEGVWPALEEARQGASAVDELVIGSLVISGVTIQRDRAVLSVRVEATRKEHREGRVQHVYVVEDWRFERAADAQSLPPDETRRLGCPSCGAAVQCDTFGRCTNCGTPITEGQLQWQAASMHTATKRRAQPPSVGTFAGDEEPSYRMDTRTHPEFASRLRAFTGRHPQFDQAGFDRRVRHVFTSLQDAWSAGRWKDARPYTTDAAWNTLRFWIDQYDSAGLANRLDDVEVLRVRVVDVSVDAWYESLTVRIWASMKDWVEVKATGEVTGGNKKVQRHFSEYWTFVRAIGSGDTSGDPDSCPSCGAPLDDINAAGVCGYCDSVITTGDFDWVLSRIDQAESYRPT